MLRNKEEEFIIHLRRDSRMTLKELSRKTTIPISTLHDKLKRFQNEFIIKHSSLIDFKKIGYSARANIIIKVNAEEKECLKEYLLTHKNINNMFRINNGYDFLLDVIFKDIEDSEKFIEELETDFKIKKIEVHYLISNLKTEEFLTCLQEKKYLI